MTSETQALADHMRAAAWVERYERQVDFSERRLAATRERATLGDLRDALADLHHDRRSLLHWQRRLDAIEAPEA